MVAMKYKICNIAFGILWRAALIAGILAILVVLATAAHGQTVRTNTRESYGDCVSRLLPLGTTFSAEVWLEVGKDCKVITAQTPVYCQPDVIRAMNHIWLESGNGTTGVEASFMLNGSPESYSIKQEPMTGEKYGQDVVIYPGQTFALFHIHPNNTGQYPSTPSNHYGNKGQGDTAMADEVHVDIYVVHRLGLSVYRWQTKDTALLRWGMDWTSPKGCQ
jgi:hypothetical protein